MSDQNRSDNGGGTAGTNQQSQPMGKKHSIDDIIDHMTADLQSYDGQYILLGSPPQAASGQHGWTEYTAAANNSTPIFLQEQSPPAQPTQQFVDVQPDTRQQLCRGLFYDGMSPTRVQELTPSGGEMIGMVDMGNGNFVNVVFNPAAAAAAAATRGNQLHHHQLGGNSPVAATGGGHQQATPTAIRGDLFYCHRSHQQQQQLHQQNQQQMHQQNVPPQLHQQSQQQLHQNQQLLQQNQQLHQQNQQLHQQNQQLHQQNPQLHHQNQQLHQQNQQLLQSQQLHQPNPQLHQQNQQLHQQLHASSVAPPTQPSSAANQVRANEYGLFTSPAGGKPVAPLQANQQLIENLVGNWLPNQSGTYSPFGCGNSTVQNASENGIDGDTSLRASTQSQGGAVNNNNNQQVAMAAATAARKPRAVAEVRPMRPTYSDVLTKSPPPPFSPTAKSPPTTTTNTTTAAANANSAANSAKSETRKQGGKNNKSGSKDSQQSKLSSSSLRRQHSSGSDDAGVKGGVGGGGGGGNSILSAGSGGSSPSYSSAAATKRWTSLEDLTAQSGGGSSPASGGAAHHEGGGVVVGDLAGYEAQETGSAAGSGRKSAAAASKAGKKKTVKPTANDDKGEPLNNHKVNNASLTGSKRPLQINNNIQRNRTNIEKNVFKSAKKGLNGNGKEDGKTNSSSLSSTKRVQRSGKRRQGHTYIDMIWTKWQHYVKLFAHWFLNLIWDVMALSTRLFLHLCQVSLDYSASTARCGWRRVSDMCGRGGRLGRLGRGKSSPPGDASSSSSSSSTTGGGVGAGGGSSSGRPWWKWWRFWGGRSDASGGRQRGEQGGKQPQSQPPHEGLANNMALPTTGDDAIKRLLSCKGKDPYSILGVTKKCNDEEIKKYYKKQAVLVHPDKNSQPGAEEAFKILVHAFELIGEPERRSRYDQCIAETHQMEHAWTELNELLTRLHQKMEYTANTLRCTNCGKRHRRVQVKRPSYAARFCAQCKINHSAREGDIWAESWALGFVWHYYACMEGQIYDISEWAACQADNLQHLKANSHAVQYRIVLGKQQQQQAQPNTQPTSSHTPTRTSEPDFEEFLNNLYSQSSTNGGASMSAGDACSSRQRRKTKRKK